ncbi:KpsF/GutQ family sugar-phosphate isomerase [Psychrosphaera sp. B3R10]|uniref:KpsF/GutQ family sugar-phosphate isomerase n=1 Tax=unclassified Psychrosphaera TaxID=2641570 RepID=UPI001C09651C|nr:MULTISPECIES: KpsF/GutQ family sugar-phosphate isomerase [unclassified Psychrosphaera]MBU2881927.1 KpsF/GutQ family sugar-phosphate isomerase [Psychrosphaera sp. I2R16]MBU2991238.1 KpsF/GutQ family sugar-phosphate isomerase [Psychrosphaera sp. B3R10]
MNSLIQSGLQVVAIEKAAIEQLSDSIDINFANACELMLACKGRIIVTGMGKSGHIANKIAATLASTGTPAFYVHPGEASHGDLGMFTDADIVLALSNSGETAEVISLLPVLKRIGCAIVSMTGKPSSTLAVNSDVHLYAGVKQEACPLGLAPTASTTASLVLGDALAVSMLEERGFTAEDFALSHPGGALGRKLLLTNKDVMHTEKRIPLVTDQATLKQAIIEMSAKGLGMTGITNDQGQLAGIFTDGDLRRCLDQDKLDMSAGIVNYMTRNSICSAANILAAETLHIMEEKKINSLFIIDDNNFPVGAINMHDLLKAGVL